VENSCRKRRGAACPQRRRQTARHAVPVPNVSGVVVVVEAGGRQRRRRPKRHARCVASEYVRVRYNALCRLQPLRIRESRRLRHHAPANAARLHGPRSVQHRPRTREPVHANCRHRRASNRSASKPGMLPALAAHRIGSIQPGNQWSCHILLMCEGRQNAQNTSFPESEHEGMKCRDSSHRGASSLPV